MKPSVLVLDEPTAGLDPAGRDEILDKIRGLHQRFDMTVILVSHSMEDVARIADNIIVMNHGKIAFYDTVNEVFSHAEELREIGLNIPQVTEIMRGLKEKGYPVDIRIHTVEDAKAEILKLMQKKKLGDWQC